MHDAAHSGRFIAGVFLSADVKPPASVPAMNERASALLDAFAAGPGVVRQQDLALMQVAIDKGKPVIFAINKSDCIPGGGTGRRFAAFDKTASREFISGASLALARQRATPTSRFCSWAV